MSTAPDVPDQRVPDRQPASPEAVRDAFESTVVMRLVSIPQSQSIHRTLRALAELGRERGMTVPELRKFFLTNKHIAEQFAIDLGAVMESRLTFPREVPSRLPRESIERAVRGMIEYFLEHVEDGSLFDHIGAMDSAWPPDSRDDLHVLLSSERFQQIVVQTFRSFVGIILDHMFGSVEGIQEGVRGEIGTSPLEDDHENVGELTPPFDLVSGFKKNGVGAISRTAYVDGNLRGSSEEKMNQRFYLSDDGRPHLASARRRERVEREARDAAVVASA